MPAPGILIGTTGTLGTGVTCTRAFRLVLMEPCFMEGAERQAFARIRRIGQQNPRTYGIRLTTDNSECERQIERRQMFRRQLRKAEDVAPTLAVGSPRLSHASFEDVA
ncbi:hypothetical protein N7470_000555 [Penicillium chermesinum]|nr:hypothetical protein N7470_000555 [Penicillium chermesinum]